MVQRATPQQVRAVYQRIQTRRAVRGRDSPKSYGALPGQPKKMKIQNLIESDIALRLLWVEMPNSNLSRHDKEDVFGWTFAESYGVKNERTYYELNDRYHNRNAEGRANSNWKEVDTPLGQLTQAQISRRHAVFARLEVSATTLGVTINATDKQRILSSRQRVAPIVPPVLPAPAVPPVVTTPQPVAPVPVQSTVLAVIPQEYYAVSRPQTTMPYAQSQARPVAFPHPQNPFAASTHTQALVVSAAHPQPQSFALPTPAPSQLMPTPRPAQTVMIPPVQTDSRPSTGPKPVRNVDALGRPAIYQVGTMSVDLGLNTGNTRPADRSQSGIAAGNDTADKPRYVSLRDLQIVPDDVAQVSNIRQSTTSGLSFFDQWALNHEGGVTDNHEQDGKAEEALQFVEDMDLDEDYSLLPAQNIPPAPVPVYSTWAVEIAQSIEHKLARLRGEPLLTQNPSGGPNVWIVRRLVRAHEDLSYRLESPYAIVATAEQGAVRPHPDLGLLNQWNIENSDTARSKFHESTFLLNGEYSKVIQTGESNSEEVFALLGKPAGGDPDPKRGKKRKTDSLLQQAQLLESSGVIAEMSHRTVRNISALDKLADETEEELASTVPPSMSSTPDPLTAWETAQSDSWVKQIVDEDIPNGYYDHHDLNPGQAVMAIMYCFGHLSAAQAMHELRLTEGEVGRVLRYNSYLSDPRTEWVNGCWAEALAYVCSEQGRRTWENALARERQQVGQKRGRLEDDYEQSQSKRRR